MKVKKYLKLKKKLSPYFDEEFVDSVLKGFAIDEFARLEDLKEDYCNIVLVLQCVLTGIAIDKACDKKLFDDPIQKIIESDESLYGIDEVLALSIINVYGSIGFTNFGYLDKEKIGIIKELDVEKTDCVNTFLDDIVAAIAAAAASRLSHSRFK